FAEITQASPSASPVDKPVMTRGCCINDSQFRRKTAPNLPDFLIAQLRQVLNPGEELGWIAERRRRD
ncbi:MAG: hypothetical protein WD017_05810, partial [Cucumibacter sp.]